MIFILRETRTTVREWACCRPVESHWQTLSYNVVHLPLSGIRTNNISSVVIGTDCTGSCKSNYHTITATTAHTNTKHEQDCVTCKRINKSHCLCFYHSFTQQSNPILINIFIYLHRTIGKIWVATRQSHHVLCLVVHTVLYNSYKFYTCILI